MKAYLIAIILGLALTPFAAHAAYASRGYFGIGGEYLLPVLFVGVVELVKMWKEELKHAKIHS